MASIRSHAPVACAMFAVAVGGCASPPPTLPTDVAAALRPPAGQVPFLEARATGVQIYDCAPKAEAAGVYAWTFRAPEAALVDGSGRSIGRHYAGPTWEAADASAVVGKFEARDPGPDPAAIPWLLLSAKAVRGSGIFSSTLSIQRLRTAGGIAPTAPCTAANAGQVARVPYTASYTFYRAAP